MKTAYISRVGKHKAKFTCRETGKEDVEVVIFTKNITKHIAQFVKSGFNVKAEESLIKKIKL